MNIRAKKQLRSKFFAKLGPNAAVFKEMFDAAPSVCFYMKDIEGRIIALNRRNCDVCNIKNEWDAIGLKSDEIFPSQYAADYMALDKKVLNTQRPVLGYVTHYPADRSMRVMISNVYPLKDQDGAIIGTARVYTLSSEFDNIQTRYGRMRRVADFIQANLANDISLTDLATAAGMSTTTLKRTFSEVFSMPPGKYLTTTRLNAVRELLETTDKLLSDIAAETGFFDQSHMTRAFKKERGITPGEYRRCHRATPPEAR